MALFSQEKIEEVRLRNDIIEVIGSYIKLKRVGNTYMGLCPFHHEKSPSFAINPDRQMYKCFGCGVGGNVITFVMEYENYTFPEALRSLAERAGVDLPEKAMTEEQKRQAGIKTTLLEINTKAARYYYARLKSPQGRTGYEYLRDRGLSDETILHFGLGYTGQGGNELYHYMRNEGYSDSILKETGLFKIEEKGAYDKFWNRVMFPIMDVNNRVIGFGGRVMGDAKPKYLNSPETKLFEKGSNLFGMCYARLSRRKGIILCEGYMDVIAMHQAGFDNAVASLGTAFTEQQANLIRRYSEEVLLIYDSDEAGVKAALRAIPILRQAGIVGKVVNLEPCKDPDEFIQTLGKEEFERRLENAQNSFFFEVAVARGQFNMADPEQKTRFYHEVARKLLVFTDKVQRDNYLEAVAAEQGIRREDLRELVIRYGSQVPEGYQQYERKQSRENEEQQRGISYSYRLLLSWLIETPELYVNLKGLVTPVDFLEEDYRRVAELLYGQLEEGRMMPAEILNHFDDAESQRKVAEMFQTGYQAKMSREEREKALNELVVRIKEYSIDKRMRELSDMNELQQLIMEKKRWQNPEKLHISLKDG